jgi:N-acetylglucosaminyldiphosphoundecaprenol N-acetyl-beta-D-mannosaminyltransferase
MSSVAEAAMMAGEIPSYRVLGVRVHAVQIPEAVGLVLKWSRDRTKSRYVIAANAHVVSEARSSARVRQALDQADLVVADGTPLMLVGRLAGFGMVRRVYGPELMLETLKASAGSGVRHFFYGGTAGVAERLADRLRRELGGVCVAGTYAPPMGPLEPRESSRALEKIRESEPDIIWAGLGAPKQELWMHSRRGELAVPVMVGVGAAFDFLAGRVAQAPEWMREHGFEWFFRLATEPRRLWRRYLLQGGDFALTLLAELATGGCRRGGGIR